MLAQRPAQRALQHGGSVIEPKHAARHTGGAHLLASIAFAFAVVAFVAFARSDAPAIMLSLLTTCGAVVIGADGLSTNQVLTASTLGVSRRARARTAPTEDV
jgi:hypothetical protein